jgi:hypothetical protein
MYASDYDKGTVPVASKCLRPAPKARATFNRAPLERLTGIYVGGDLQMDRDCFLDFEFAGPMVHEAFRGGYGGRIPITKGMKLGGPIPARARSPGPAWLRIDEGDTHFGLEIADAFTQRALTLVSPADGVLRAGQPVTVRWQPGTDDISQGEIGLGRPGSNTEQWVTIRNKDLSIHGDRIEFTLPATLPDTLHGGIEIRFLGTAYVKPRFGPCPVDKCSVRLIFDVPPLTARLP